MADLVTLMENIAKAIRLKTGNNEKINAQDFPQKIQEIETNKEIGKNLIINNNSISVIEPTIIAPIKVSLFSQKTVNTTIFLEE